MDRLRKIRTFSQACSIRLGVFLTIIILVLATEPAMAASSLVAGLQITNVAAVQFDDARGEHTQNSNSVSTVVDAVLDVTVAAVSPSVDAGRGYLDQPLGFVITNTGNGPETFDLTAAAALPGASFDPVFKRIVIDADNDGKLNMAIDTVYSGGATRPVLQTGQSVTVWVVCDMPANASGSGLVMLSATVSSGHGAPGLTLVGLGQGGGDAVVGSTGASATAQAGYAIRALHTLTALGGDDQGPSSATLIKSQTVTDITGHGRPMSGSTITYSLTAQFTGSGPFVGARISDAIPTGTTYIAGSLTLDGAAVADAAGIGVSGVSVPLGDVAGAVQHIVTFKVLIK